MATEPVWRAEPMWLVNARELVGLREIVGSRHEAKILQFFAEAGHSGVKDDETAWCAAFVGAMLRRGGYSSSGALNARSYLTYGTKLEKPAPGCIVVFKRGNSSWQGHVGFFLRDLGSTIEVLGGNQSNSVSIGRYQKSDLLGYRWPSVSSAPAATKPAVVKPVEKPATNVAATKAAAGAGAVVIAGGAAAAAQQGISATDIVMWIGGLSAVAVAAFVIGYKIIKGEWPWTSTGAASQEPLPLLPQSSAPSLEQLSQARLALSSVDMPAAPSPPPLALRKPRQRSAKPSRRTPMRRRKSRPSRRSAARKSLPKRKSKSKG